MPRTEESIADIPELVEALPPGERALFQRIFHISRTTGRLIPPRSMHPWIKGYFGSVEAVLRQRIVKVTNLITMEGSLFNELRARRPMEARESTDLKRTIVENVGDPFCQPMEGTPEDVFGRVRGKGCITASNIAKYDGFHGLVVFDEHDPLVFSKEGVADYIDTALAWGREAHSVDPQARYFFFMWNCLWRSGASIIHGHAQMTLSRDMHYAKVEGLRRAALAYRAQYGSNYFADLFRVHAALNCGFEAQGVKVIAYLTPIKEKETLLVADELNEELKGVIYEVLCCFVERLDVTSFNLAIYMPPIAPVDEDWSGFPVLARFVDRGDPMNRTSDFGAMELYASSVIASDPFRVAEALRDSLLSP